MKLVLLALFLINVVFGTSTTIYKQCGTDINNLWLDIVLVIDNSKIMNIDGVYSTIQSLFGPNVQIGTGYKDPRSTRVAIVTYSEKATVVADFSKFKSLEMLNEQLEKLNATQKSESFSAYMDLGLQAANNLIIDANNANDRRHYRKLIILFTSNYAYKNKRPDVLALSIRQSGVDISTVYTGAGTTGNAQFQLTFVGNYNMNFHMADSPIPIVRELQGATTMANCFCKTGWYQYEWPRNSGNLFGICVASLNQNDYQSDARKYCKEAAKNAYMVSEFDKNKRAFNYDFITSHGSKTVGSYYNGLISQNGSWYWDQPDGMPLLPLDPSSGSVSAKSGCVADVKYSDGSIAWSPISCGNRLPYICEMPTCDTDFYCF
ncbi:hypothetical protein B9Z55_004600 [Caenorhabditis nigoni]|uniref:VWFA domain-containing protein n=1 Tax=Caenorhabditis nigoni TaxID=1611254 RepID=A0A2G5UX48_9PELO|nr:hypothetical protein B9Z55_004600 [Caenorhabditis nigoni]